MTEWKGQDSGVGEGSHLVIRSQPQWQALWARIGQAAPSAPDFQSSFAVAVFLGQRSTGGYRVQWLEPEAAGPATVVRYRELKPRGFAIQALTKPFAVKVFASAAAEIIVEAIPE